MPKSKKSYYEVVKIPKMNEDHPKKNKVKIKSVLRFSHATANLYNNTEVENKLYEPKQLIIIEYCQENTRKVLRRFLFDEYQTACLLSCWRGYFNKTIKPDRYVIEQIKKQIRKQI